MSAYAESKCQAEQLVLKANEDTLQTCVLRLRGLYGPGDQTCCKRTLDICKSGMLQARFEKSEPNLSQYLSIGNCVQALTKAEEALRNKQSPACGRPYFIVDGGEPVDSMGFWKPLIEAAGGRMPTVKVPFVLVYLFAWILEWAYHLFGIEPLMTRMELCVCAITNTYSIEAARRDFGYDPVNNHDLGETVKWAKTEVQLMRNAKASSLPSKVSAYETQVKRLFGVLAM
ncbi:short-chain dehydrogenase/reductase family 42E member 1-like protein, partial [Aphelenchoides avenae]